jgi:UDP-2,4-diacetamido-2,4,6-trideoxy-beta-L-altropyranose hydrolase
VSRIQLHVAIRADASSRIGLGHIKRSLSLASALIDVGAQVRLVTRDMGLDVSELIDPRVACDVLPAPSASSFIIESVPQADLAGIDWRCDVDETIAALRDWRPHWVIVDHYGFDARWHMRAAEELGSRIAVIDDLADRPLSADLIIDHNPHANHREKYRGLLAQVETIVLGGTRFALLGAEFARAAPLTVREKVRSIGIFMGGTDASELSAIALNACRVHAAFRGPIEVVSTRGNPNAARLEGLARKWPDTTVSYDLPDLVAFFGRHDLQIGAGGGATWERCCIGAPMLLLKAAQNQTVVLREVERLGVAAVYDPGAAHNETDLGRAVSELIADENRRRALSQRARALVDGLGARRVALCIAGASLNVRPAVPADAELMFRWRNHPETRRMSRCSAELVWDEHVHWLKCVLIDADHKVFVGQVGQLDVGVIRFQRWAEGVEVSLYLDPMLHGLGLGRRLLQSGEQEYAAVAAAPVRFTAVVLSGNRRSELIFEQCGYSFDGTSWSKDVFPAHC